MDCGGHRSRSPFKGVVMIGSIFLIAGALFLAYTNGANDNFKGVATLYGSKTTAYKTALSWATVTTFAGSICSIFLARSLLKTFSGEGLVPAAVSSSPDFLIAVSIGAALTVLAATLTGFPISTTHGLTGALVGAGLVAVGSQVRFSVLGTKFFLPLLASPFLALTLAALFYPVFRLIRIRLNITKENCLCVGEKIRVVPIPQPASVLAFSALRSVEPSIDTEVECFQRYNGRFFGLSVQKLLDGAHYASAGAVSFARGLNDTPKIFALLFSLKLLGVKGGLLAVAVGIALGGLLNARRVAQTVGRKITGMNHGQGLTANLVTAFLVIFASRLGVPVSTTHVSVGSLFGIGMVSGKADYKVISEVILSWVLTLPVAAVLSGLIFWLVS